MRNLKRIVVFMLVISMLLPNVISVKAAEPDNTVEIVQSEGDQNAEGNIEEEVVFGKKDYEKVGRYYK